ncbi:MAG: MFS transporter [Microlunatus sp.]
MSTSSAGPAMDTRMRDFRLLMVGRTLSLIGASMTGLAVMLLALELSGSATIAGGVAAAITLGGLLTALPAGALVDRLDRKRIMVVSAGTLAAALFSVPVAALFGVVSLWHLVVVSFLVGALATFYDPAETAAVKRLVAADRLGVAVTVQQVRGSIGNLVGGPLAGALFGLGRFVPLIGDALANVVAAVLAGMVRTDLEPVSRTRSNVVKEAAEGISWLLKSPGPRTVALVSAVNMFGISCLMTGVTLGLRVSGQPAAVVGLVQTVLGAALLVGSLLTPRIQRIASLGRIFLVSSALQVVLTFALLRARQPEAVFVVFGLLALTGPPSPISLRAWFMAATPDRLQGRATAALGLVTIASAPLSTVLTGWLLEHAGRTSSLLPAVVASAVTLVAGLFSQTLRSLPRIDGLSAVADEAEAASGPVSRFGRGR